MLLSVIGLDGGDWSTIYSFLESTKLTNLQELLTDGVQTNLLSIIPPVTGPAWPAIATGLNPGKLGTFDFYNRTNLKDYALYPVRSDQLRKRAIWDELSQKGYRVGIFGYPMLVPTYEVNGWMVAGLGASKLHEWAWPSPLQEELNAIADPFTISVSYGLPKYRNNLALLLHDLSEMLEGQIAALHYLLQKYPVDVLIAVFGVTDVLSHISWHLIDQAHPLYDAQLATQHGPALRQIWSRVDKAVGMLLETMDDSGQCLVISDHGFGQSFGVFNTNVWLETNGYLVRSNGSGSLSNKLRASLVNQLAPFLAPLLRKLQGSSLHQKFRESILREINLAETKAFALETTDVTGMIFVNRHYARLHSLEEDSFVTNVKDELKTALERYARENDLTIDVFLPEELYNGSMTHLAPDLLFSINKGAVSASYRFASEVYEERLHTPMKTGNHRREGIFIGYGSKFNSGIQLNDLHILDIAPTIYHLLEEPLPADLDGRVAKEALCPQYQDTVQFYTKETADLELDQRELTVDGEMQRHLRQLGYLD